MTDRSASMAFKTDLMLLKANDKETQTTNTRYLVKALESKEDSGTPELELSPALMNAFGIVPLGTPYKWPTSQ